MEHAQREVTWDSHKNFPLRGFSEQITKIVGWLDISENLIQYIAVRGWWGRK